MINAGAGRTLAGISAPFQPRRRSHGPSRGPAQPRATVCLSARQSAVVAPSSDQSLSTISANAPCGDADVSGVRASRPIVAAADHCAAAATTSIHEFRTVGDVEGPASCRCGAVITSIRLISRGPTSNGMVPGYGLLAIVHDGDDKAVRSMIS